MIQNPVAIYASLAIVGVVSLIIDMVGHGKTMSTKQAFMWSFFWVAIGLGFGGIIYALEGGTAASEYYAGYLMEKSLSFDNLMVFYAIFTFFGVASAYQMHKVLTYGILGAIIFRAIFVGVGAALFHLHWSIQILFGLVVIWSARSVLKGDDDEKVDFDSKWYIRGVKKFYPVHTDTSATKFFTYVGGIRHITPLLLCVVAIELCDVIFSFDSVPAVIGVSKETPIIYSAMIMAILGLRALFFVVKTLIEKLVHLDKAVAVVLVFIGAKLILGALGYEIDPYTSLVIVFASLLAGVIASLVSKE